MVCSRVLFLTLALIMIAVLWDFICVEKRRECCIEWCVFCCDLLGKVNFWRNFLGAKNFNAM
jgi:hypothetical protein